MTLQSKQLDVVAKCELFRDMSPAELSSLLKFAETRRFAKDHFVLIDRQQSEGFFLVLTGKIDIEISLPNQSGQEVIASLTPGQVLGELAILDVSRRSASAKATEAASALFWKRSDIESLMAQDKDFAFHLMRNMARILAHRLVSTTKGLGTILYQSLYVGGQSEDERFSA